MGKAALAIKKNIAVIKDFPIKGISFQDIFSITRKPEIFKLIIQEIIKVINKQLYKNNTISYFENIFTYQYDYKVEHLKGGSMWIISSEYIIKELGIEYLSDSNEDITKNVINKVYNHI